ncbi:MAG TPA: YjbH domain-containing protein [Stellaceae bacterium]|nr:YjbH domain-containing protein [Stellaceae bacterium]
MLARLRPLLFAAALGMAALPRPADAQNQLQTGAPSFTATYDDWGEHGLLQTPTARPGTDGDFAFTYSHVHPYDRYNVFMTPLPWLEAGFRYTAINDRPYGPANPSQSYKDKSFDAKIRLVQESADFPETAIGFRDIAGTGLFSSEYIVFSRRYYDFDVSAGMGWGYMSSRATFGNPLGLIAHAFKVRPATNGTGSFTLDYFRGRNVALFGGVEYHTAIEGVRIKLELDPSDYHHEPLQNNFGVRSPVNAAVVYRPAPYMEFSAGLERGTTVMLRATVTANFNSLGFFRDPSTPPALEPRPVPQPPEGRKLDETGLPLVAEPAVGRPLDETGLPLVAEPDEEPQAPPPVRIARAKKPRRAPPAPAPTRAAAASDRFYDIARLAPPPVASDAAGDSDRLYDGARQLGYDIDTVAIDGDKATLSITPRAGGTHAAPSERVAALAVAVLPGVSRAIIAGSGAGAMETQVAPSVAATPADSEPAVAERVFADLKKTGLRGESFAMKGRHAWLSLSQDKYHVYTIALGRAARIVAADAPPGIELVTIELVENNLTAASVTMRRRDIENAVGEVGSPEEVFAHATFAGSSPDRPPGIANAAAYPYYDWGLNPRLRQQLGGPDNFVIYEIYAELAGTAHLAPGLSLDGSLGANLFNNLNALHPQSASALPHVRSDIDLYLKQGKTGIFQLQGDELFNIAPDWYGRVSGGILEYMYDGVDGEVLYRPYDNRLAIGLDVNHVFKRDFRDRLGLRAYQVTEGQLSFYYKLPFYNLTATLRVGRYLAGDKGATIELSRVFAGGVRAGIFATKTNVSATQFGEGSFDKGFFVSFPLDLMLASPSRDEASYLVRPLTRDGGQYVAIAKPLYQETDRYDSETLSGMWPQLFK